MKILLVYYHPVIFDIAESLKLLGHEVVVAVNTEVKDSYGTGSEIIKRFSDRFSVIPLKLAFPKIKKKVFDLVGCDGVFDGDDIVMSICKDVNMPWFCIQGYPGIPDEPSKNILSLGWSLPIVHYLTMHPSEAHRKTIDWCNIFEKGRSDGKNTLVFYPQCWDVSRYILQNGLPKDAASKSGFISVIQKFAQANKYNFFVFLRFCEKFKDTKNLEGLDQQKVYEELSKAKALIHLKQGDQPGMAVLESMLLGTPPIVMSSFVYTSFNQDLLIDGHTAIVANTFEELIEKTECMTDTNFYAMGLRAQDHAMILTNFGRQKYKLQKFLERCVE